MTPRKPVRRKKYKREFWCVRLHVDGQNAFVCYSSPAEAKLGIQRQFGADSFIEPFLVTLTQEDKNNLHSIQHRPQTLFRYLADIGKEILKLQSEGER